MTKPAPPRVRAAMEAVQALRAEGLTWAEIARLCHLGNNYYALQSLADGTAWKVSEQTTDKIMAGYSRYLDGDRSYLSKRKASPRPQKAPRAPRKPRTSNVSNAATKRRGGAGKGQSGASTKRPVIVPAEVTFPATPPADRMKVPGSRLWDRLAARRKEAA